MAFACHFVEPRELAERIRRKEGGVLVIDVRDEEEFRAGHIAAAVSAPATPADGFLSAVQRLPTALSDADVVVVHCAHSRQRGPRCALQLERAFPRRSFEVVVLSGGYFAFASQFPDLCCTSSS